MPSAVADDIRKLIADQLGVDVDKVIDTANIVDDLDADSLDVVELVIAIEGQNDIEIPEADAEKLITVKDVIDYVERRT
jgi:acyl carrier protein